jgi:hypothetical protein
VTASASVLRLPAGWAAAGEHDGYAVAAPACRRPGDPVVLCRSIPSVAAGLSETAGGVVGGLQDARDDLLVLDVEPYRARRGAEAVRVLTCWRDGDDSRTAEHRLVGGGDVLHVLTAVTATSRYAAAAAGVGTVLDRFRPGSDRQPVRFVDPPDAVNSLDIEPLCLEPLCLEPLCLEPLDDEQPAELVVLDVEILRGRRPGCGVVTTDGATAVVELPGLGSPRTVPATLVGGWLAALVDLGPRPRPPVSGQVVTDRARLAALSAGGGLADEPLPPGWADALSALAPAAHWRVGPLEVLDGGAGGLWQVGTVDDRWLAAELDGAPAPADPVALRPTDPTLVWAALTGLIRCRVPADAR